MINTETIINIKTIKTPNNNDEFEEYTYRKGNYEKLKFVNISYFERIITFDNINDIVTSNKYNFKPNDKIFFGANCTIPRHKVREWGKDKKITITVKPEKSNVSVISESFFNSINDYSVQYRNILLDKYKFIDFLKLNYKDKVDELIDKIINTTSKYILVQHTWKDSNIDMLGHNYDNENLFTNYLYSTPKKYTDAELKAKQIKSTYCDMHENNEFDTYSDKTCPKYIVFEDNHVKLHELNKILNISSNNTIIFDTTLINVVNQDAITIDDEMFNQLRNMFKSDDVKNHVIALEVLSNCNYKTSLHKILLIFREFANYRIHNMKEKSHVNFKSLTKFINISDWYYPSYDDMINTLIDKNYLTKEILNEISVLAKKEMEEILEKAGYNVFEIKNITLSNRVKRYFGYDIPYSEKEKEKLNK